jgi:LysM repeat protein
MNRNVWSRVKVIVPMALLIVVLLLPASASAWGGNIHVVQRGENLYRIAMRYGTSVQAIAMANGLPNPNRIYVGQRLVIPAGGYYPPSYPPSYGPSYGCNTVHIVRCGQTLYSIARMYGTSVWAIAGANGLANPNYIYAGQRLFIPCGGLGKPVQYGCSGGGRFSITVQFGDTLYSIARRYGTCVQQLMQANCLANPNLIRVGQRLFIR